MLADAARTGDGRVRTGDPLLAKQVLCQLSYAPSDAGDDAPDFWSGTLSPQGIAVSAHHGAAWRGRRTGMGQGGFEPPTPRLSSVCSNQLSYWPQGFPPQGETLERIAQARDRGRSRPGGFCIAGRDTLTAPDGQFQLSSPERPRHPPED